MKTAEVYAKLMTEAELSDHVRNACDALKLRSYHTYDSRKSSSGFPDWAIVGRSGLIFRELKTEKGRLSVDQVLWLEDLARTGHDADVWRPADLLSGRIMRELRELATRSPDGPGGQHPGVRLTGESNTRAEEGSLDSREGSDFDASADKGSSRPGGAS